MIDEVPELPALPRFQPGDRVADYVIEGPLGDGCKHVYRACETAATRRSVALKIVPIRALRGVPAASRTNGIPHVVTTHAVGIDEEWRVGFVAMEHVRGQSLADCVDMLAASRRRPTQAQRRAWVGLLVQVARGLQELHRRGVVHCDVKPHNIVLENDAGANGSAPRAVLVDLGIARNHGVPAVHSTLMHAAAYSAPEQLLGQRLDGRTDVFAFGVTLYDLLLGQSATQRPLRPTLGLERLDRVDPSIDLDLAAIVGECTALSPAHRYADMGRLTEDLERWLGGRRPGVRPRAPWRRFARMAVRRPRTAVASVLLALTFVSALALAGVDLAASLARKHRWSEYQESVSGGDFDRAARIARTVSIGEDVADRGEDPGAAAVLALLCGGDAAGARRHAARLCSRDGLASHPSLDRWFARLLQSPDAPVRLDACRLLARALFDHPQVPGEALPVVCEPLLAVATEDPTESALFAITATAALAEPSLGDRLLAAAVRQHRQHPNGHEFLRLLVEALHRLAFESAIARATPDAIERFEGQLHACAELLRNAPDFADWSDLVRDSAVAWLETIRKLRDAAGMLPPDPAPLLSCWPAHPLLRSLGRSPSLVEELASGAWAASVTAFDLGVLVGYAKPAAERLERVRTALANDTRLQGQAARAEFEAGRASAEEALACTSSPWAADVGSRLADELVAMPAWTAVPTVVGRSRSPTSSIAVFDLLEEPMVCSGSTGAVAGVCVRQQWDEHRPPCAFGWMGSPGRSAFEFEFLEPVRPHREMIVWLYEQKGTRGAFPYGGDAGLDMLVDGVPHASWRDLGGVGARAIPLAMAGTEGGRLRRLTLRLRNDANTTLRLYRVEIK